MKIHTGKIKKLSKKFEVYNNIFISKSNLLYNFDLLTSITNHDLIPVLKSNAYGHGIEQITEILEKRTLPYIAVDGYFEALRIKKLSRQKVLVMGQINPVNFSRINTKNLTFVVHSTDTIEAIGRTNKLFKVHIELETGMNRHGVKPRDLDAFLHNISKHKNIRVDGIMSHLADSDNSNNSFTKHQVRLFDKCVEKIIEFGFKPKYIHIAQSAGSVKVNSKYANCVRSGIALYGVSPLQIKDKSFDKLKDLKPVLRLSSTISKTLELKKNETISYSQTYKAKDKTTIGILPIGYYEGVSRQLSNIGKVAKNESYAPIRGRVCMNHTIIDITKSNHKLYDEITLISNDKNSDICVMNLCKKYNLFSYSILCNLSSDIRRTIV